jgi:hypothetical protein
VSAGAPARNQIAISVSKIIQPNEDEGNLPHLEISLRGADRYFAGVLSHQGRAETEPSARAADSVWGSEPIFWAARTMILGWCSPLSGLGLFFGTG